ncbi:hypothetical protein D3C76_1466610 [compost metagenome]
MLRGSGDAKEIPLLEGGIRFSLIAVRHENLQLIASVLQHFRIFEPFHTVSRIISSRVFALFEQSFGILLLGDVFGQDAVFIELGNAFKGVRDHRALPLSDDFLIFGGISEHVDADFKHFILRHIGGIA